ncbi:MAG: S8 family peptidase [Acidobacteriota bacterium]
MTESNQRKLDPRLRRQMHAFDQPARLLNDLRSDLTMATTADAPAAEALTADAVSPALLTRRVLVTLDGDVPDDLADLDWSCIADRYYAVDIPLARLDALRDAEAVRFVEAARGYFPFLDTSLGEVRADAVHAPEDGTPGATGEGVVVGIIDSSLDVTLDDFRNEDGTTRVAFLWDQNLTPQGDESSPEGYTFGVEYDRDAIDAALAADAPGQIRHRWEAGSHGTHVAGIAAGNGRSADDAFPAGQYVGVAPGATLIFVAPRFDGGVGTFTDSASVARAIAYVFERAAQLGMPAVINMSLGQNGGSHDGESTVERAIDRLLDVPGRAFVSAAGNEHIWRGHASGRLVTGETRTLQWRVGGGLPLPWGEVLPEGELGDFSVNEMEIWYGSRDRFRVRLLAPSGHATDWVVPDESALPFALPNGNEVFIDSERFTVLNGDARIYIEVSPVDDFVERGIWQVEIEALEARDGDFDAFIERDARRRWVRLRDGRVVDNRYADQSFFGGDDFDPTVTLGTPATARRSIAVANYDNESQVINPSSSRGPTRDGRAKPEIAAPGTGIVASNADGGQPDPRDASQRVPMRVSKDGTSMAAPHVAGAIALMLERDPRLTVEQIRKILIAAAAPSPTGLTVFDPAWGYGRLDVRRAVDLVDGGV